MRNRLWILPLAVLLLLVAAHFAYWRYLESELQRGFATFLAERRVAGWTTHASGVAGGGWPLAATLRVTDLALEGGDPDIPGGLAWGAGQVELRIDLLAPATLHLQADGPQRARVGPAPPVAFTAGSMTATIPLAADGLPRAVSATIRDLRGTLASAPERGAATAGLVQIDAAMDWAAPRDRPAIGVQAAAEAIGLPPARSWALGNRISSVSIEAALGGPLPPPGPLTRTAAAWRDGGGVLQVRRLTLGWGPLGVSGAGTLSLDPGLQPAGTMQVRLAGFGAALDALAAGRVMTPGAATAAKAVLSLLAAPAPAPANGGQAAGGQDGGQSQVEVPLVLQDGIVALRQLPVLRLPPIVWPVEPRPVAPGG